MYLSTSTRPDISHTISSLNYLKEHWRAVKRVFRYLQGTQNYALTYSRSEKSELQGYVDADWGSCVEDKRSYTGYVFLYAGGAISWEARKQKTVALSSTEAEYMAMTEATKEAICLKNLLADLNVIKPEEPVSLKNDNCGAQELAQNPEFEKVVSVTTLHTTCSRMRPMAASRLIRSANGTISKPSSAIKRFPLKKLNKNLADFKISEMDEWIDSDDDSSNDEGEDGEKAEKKTTNKTNIVCSDSDKDQKAVKEMKGVEEESALRKLLTSDEDEDEEEEKKEEAGKEDAKKDGKEAADKTDAKDNNSKEKDSKKRKRPKKKAVDKKKPADGSTSDSSSASSDSEVEKAAKESGKSVASLIY
ncbi:unnamed protein product [Nesidiocoris tenuis]|uniref:Reverse transcriptase Ty1/copia-type domain-containing protein n=1 Tax=Nesidiocoris tenuis TaxID=355587 RepID=A0A6H5HLM1_9HEMI|nr:unnamed protein product [Nesidiocoris tenuis]